MLLAAVTHVKYKCDLKDQINISAKSKMYQMEKLVIQASEE